MANAQRHDEAHMSDTAQEILINPATATIVAACAAGITAIITTALQKRKTPIDAQIDIQKVVNDSFKHLVDGSEKQIASLRIDIEMQERTIERLTTEVTRQSSLIDDLTEQVAAQAEVIQQYTDKLHKQDVTIATLRSKLTDLNIPLPEMNAN